MRNHYIYASVVGHKREISFGIEQKPKIAVIKDKDSLIVPEIRSIVTAQVK